MGFEPPYSIYLQTLLLSSVVRADDPRTMPQFRLPNQRVAIVSICAYGETEPVRIIGTENHQRLRWQRGRPTAVLPEGGLCGLGVVELDTPKPIEWSPN